MWDLPGRVIGPAEPKYIGWCEYCCDDIYDGEELDHLDCDENPREVEEIALRLSFG